MKLSECVELLCDTQVIHKKSEVDFRVTRESYTRIKINKCVELACDMRVLHTKECGRLSCDTRVLHTNETE